MNRSGFLVVHRWIGLALAPFLLLQVLTGTFLVVHEIAQSSPPAEMVSVGQLVAGAPAGRPGLRVTRLYLPGSTGDTAFAEMAGPGGATYAELDARTGKPLATGALWHFPYRWAVQVHYRLADGTAGMIVVCAIGLALALTALSGLWFWWPGLRRVPQALRLPRAGPARLRLRQWHRFIGAPASLLALFSAITGLLLIVPDIAATFTPAPAAPVASALPVSPAAIDRAVASAQARFSGSFLRDVRFPVADRLDINFDAPERNARAVHVASVRLSDGVLLKSLPAGDNPVLWMKVLAFHTGQSLGPGGPVLLLAEGAALLFLAIAGVVMWLRARGGRRA